jgi:CRP/FNR family cyclic AMP-dependent transcriptional regulator
LLQLRKPPGCIQRFLTSFLFNIEQPAVVLLNRIIDVADEYVAAIPGSASNAHKIIHQLVASHRTYLEAIRGGAWAISMVKLASGLYLPKDNLRNLLQCGALRTRTIRLRRHDYVYSTGDGDERIYLIESGQIKLIMPTLTGKECLLNIFTVGELFGESCLTGAGERMEAAVAMEDTTLRCIPYRDLLVYLMNNALHREYQNIIQCLARRLVEQQQSITDFVTSNSEYRLGRALLLLGGKLGKRGPVAICIEHNISHEELSQIVGTTRPRVSGFIQKFRTLGLIDITAERFMVINEKELANYLSQSV